jgi:DNA-methyltransferase (dcm)
MNSNLKRNTITAIDLFCGTGGLTHGLKLSGVDVVSGYDLDGNVRYAYETNNDAVFFQKSIEEITPTELTVQFGTGYTLLAGCAPCQPFSQLNNGKIVKRRDWGLLYDFSRLVEKVLPTFVTMENVPQLKNHEVYKDFISNLLKAKYSVFEKVVLCADYGVPQKRKRLVVLASRLGDIKLIPPRYEPKTYKTVRDTIYHLKPLAAGETDLDDRLHSASVVSELNLKRLRYSRQNGSWLDWPADLVAPCHRKIATNNYFSAYGRMAWDEPAPTITTGCHGISHGRFGHPEQDRALSFREAALLQSFPPEYEFSPNNHVLSKAVLARMIGNAVPVELGRAIGDSFFSHLEEHNV